MNPKTPKLPRMAWDLNMVLAKLVIVPFEPLCSASLKHLTWKTMFLVAITSARRISELQAFVHYPLYMQFLHNKVFLRTHPKFLLKVVSEFHLNQSIVLPAFFPNFKIDLPEQSLHTLDCKWALFYYTQLKIWDCPRNFLSLSNLNNPRRPTSKETLCYAQAHLPAPGRVGPHHLCAISTTVTSLAAVSTQDICKAAT